MRHYPESIEVSTLLTLLTVNTLNIVYEPRVEEELRLLSDITGDGGGDGTARRGSTSARRSFFRRKKHPRSSSRDSKEVASFSNTQLSWFSDSGMLSEEGTMLSYQRVERLDCKIPSFNGFLRNNELILYILS